MKDVHFLSRWLFPATIKTLEAKIARLAYQNYKLKRKVAFIEKHCDNKCRPYDLWTAEDWDDAYGPTNKQTKISK